MLLLDKVEGMQVGLTLGLEIQEGTLTLSLMDCGCFVKEITIMLDGGASWLYQGYAPSYLAMGHYYFDLILKVIFDSFLFHSTIHIRYKKPFLKTHFYA